MDNFHEKSLCPQDWQYRRTAVQLRLWKKKKILKTALGKLIGASCGVYRCFLQLRLVNRGKNNSSESPLKKTIQKLLGA